MSEVIEKFDVRNRWSGEVQFTAEIAVTPDMTPAFKLGLAVKWGFKNRARLDGARLDGARLDGARLDGASLDGASLDGASLDGARLDGASLDGASLVGASLDGASLDGARLDGASLDGARLDGASLVGARLDGARLVGARLDGARLDGARLDGAILPDEALRSFKADLFLTLFTLRAGPIEAVHLIQKLRAGKVDGSTYGDARTECACLVGTIAQAKDVSYAELDHGAGRPAERWFTMIRPGDKAGDESGGGFAAQKALEWTLEYCAAMGIDPDAPPPPLEPLPQPEAA